MTVSRARAFGTAAAEYATHRPGYPEPAVAWALEPVRDRPAAQLLDLAAGTGKLTAELRSRGAVTAVEPDPAMLGELHRHFPEVTAVEGSAEEIPLPDASVDAVLVGSAWHWFDHDRALREIARVLRPGCVLAILGNGEDRRIDWVRGYREVRERERDTPRRGDGRRTLPAHPAFGPSECATFPNPIRTTADGLVAMLGTHSWALTATPAARASAFRRVRAYLAGRPETSAGEFELPLVTEVVRALRK